MLFSGTIVFPDMIARCFNQCQLMSSCHQDDQHALNCSTSFDQGKHLLFGASGYTASSYKHNCTRVHSNSHTSILLLAIIIISVFVAYLKWSPSTLSSLYTCITTLLWLCMLRDGRGWRRSTVITGIWSGEGSSEACNKPWTMRHRC